MFIENLFIPSGVSVAKGRACAIALFVMGNSVHPVDAARRVCGWATGLLEPESRQVLNGIYRRGSYGPCRQPSLHVRDLN